DDVLGLVGKLVSPGAAGQNAPPHFHQADQNEQESDRQAQAEYPALDRNILGFDVKNEQPVEIDPRAVKHQQRIEDHQQHDEQADPPLRRRRQQLDHSIDADMCLDAHAIGGADQHQPAEQIEVGFKTPQDRSVEYVAQHHLHEA